MKQFLWTPGDGVDSSASERLRAYFRSSMSFSETLNGFPRLNCGSRLSTSRVAQARLDRCPNGVFGTTTCWQPFYHEAMRHTSAICWRACSPASWQCPNHWLSPGCAPCSKSRRRIGARRSWCVSQAQSLHVATLTWLKANKSDSMSSMTYVMARLTSAQNRISGITERSLWRMDAAFRPVPAFPPAPISSPSETSCPNAAFARGERLPKS